MSARRQYRQAQLFAAYAGGGLPRVIAHYKRVIADYKRRAMTPVRWVRAAWTHPIQTFAALTFLYLWSVTGRFFVASALTVLFVVGGVALWFEYRRMRTGLTYTQAARQLQMQRRIKARWTKACLAGGIAAKTSKGMAIPPLTKIRADKGDVTARIYTGQLSIPSTDVVKNLIRISETVGCREVTMRPVSSGVLDLRFCYTNPLDKVVKPADLKLVPKNLVPFGVTDSGEAITIPVLNADGETEFRSLLIGGVSGSGKSSALWAILSGFIVRDVPVELRVSDASGGVELAELGKAMEQDLGTDRFRVTRYGETKAETDTIIKEMLADMYDRLASMKAAGVRKHKPTPQEPLVILVIDELLLIKALLKAGADSDIGQMLSVCRKAGYGVIACTILAEKATLGECRELFPFRIAFRMNTRPQTTTILGDDQADIGPAHSIPRNQPGVGYTYEQATDTMTKFRAVHITDVQTKQIAMGVAPDGLENYGKAPAVEDVPRAVYWHYGYPDPETGGRKLWYVGSASDPNERFKQHEKDRKSRSWWNKTDHSARRIEWYPTQAEGFAAEWAAIDRDQPLYNDKGNRDNPARLTDEPAVDEGAMA